MTQPRSVESEQQTRESLAARIGEQPDHYLVHPYGAFYDEVTASSLVKIDQQGQPVDADSPWLNDGGQNLARWIFGQRAEVNYFVHGHCENVTAVSATRYGLMPMSQPAIYLGHLVGYIDYAFIEDDDFGDEFMSCVASHDILISHNYGYYCLGCSAREAFFRAYYLRQACEVQVKAMSMVGGDIDRLRLVNSERETGYRDAMYTSEDYNYDGKTEWQGMLRWLGKHGHDYKC